MNLVTPNVTAGLLGWGSEERQRRRHAVGQLHFPQRFIPLLIGLDGARNRLAIFLA